MLTLTRKIGESVCIGDEIKVVILRGHGGVFSTGVDLNRAYGWYDKPGENRRPSQRGLI